MSEGSIRKLLVRESAANGKTNSRAKQEGGTKTDELHHQRQLRRKGEDCARVTGGMYAMTIFTPDMPGQLNWYAFMPNCRGSFELFYSLQSLH